MTMVEAAPFVPDLDVALSWVESLPDQGEWQDSPVTHWHMTYSEASTRDDKRFEQERWAGIVARPTSVAYTPREALAWLVEQECKAIAGAGDPVWVMNTRLWWNWEMYTRDHLVSWRLLTLGWDRCPSSGSIKVRPGWTVELYANPMTTACHQR